ncbi:hypothetical protein [Paenibacillus sp. GCM10023250]|uniref:hypothetical protein n=1 Tax=Paenibacillus sp. GCM10023250 TaxID=3252648 RepID=UPI00361B26EC
MIIYDTRFNMNEWFVLSGFVIGIGLVLILPKRFTLQQSILFYMCGAYSGFFFDHSLSVTPLSLYDVNDTSDYEWIDFLSYFAYGAVAYMFFYVYDKFRIRPAYIPVYILIWSLASVGFEWISVKLGVFHYNYGYKLAYSFAIYLFVQTAWIALFFRYGRGNAGNTGYAAADLTKAKNA